MIKTKSRVQTFSSLILQFSDGPPPNTPDFDQSLIRTESLVVHVEEEQGVVKLLVVRAAGWHGDVSVEWRSRDGTAISTQSPRDYVVGYLMIVIGICEVGVDLSYVSSQLLAPCIFVTGKASNTLIFRYWMMRNQNWTNLFS